MLMNQAYSDWGVTVLRLTVTDTVLTPLGKRVEYVSVTGNGADIVAGVDATWPLCGSTYGRVPAGVVVDGVGVQVAPVGHDDAGEVVVVVVDVVVVVGDVLLVVGVVRLDELPPPPQPTTSEDNTINRIFFILRFLMNNQAIP
jgi:hypothetical protein